MRFEQRTTTSLTFIAETPYEVLDLLNHFRLDQIKHLPELNKGFMEYTSNPKKRFWYPVTAELSPEWMDPYYKLLERITGYSGKLIDLDPAPSPGLCHTHVVQTSRVRNGVYFNEGFIQAEDWNGQDAEYRAAKNFDEYTKAFIGHITLDPEYLMDEFGRERRNPNYLRRNPATPALEKKELFTALFKEWEKLHATEGQKLLIQKGIECERTIRCNFYERFVTSPWADSFHIENHTKQVSYSDFQRA